MATIFKIRRDTASNWASENTVLSAGEMGLDQTNNFIKMGDGTTAWNSLAQFTQNIENVEDLVGAMFASNTETFISVTYNDADGSVDFVVPVLDEDNMASDSAAHLATQQSIKAYVDTNDALKLALAGGTMSGVIAMGSNKITGVTDPTANQDAATKAYVDTQVAAVPVGDITSVVAGSGLTGGGTTGDVTVNVIAGIGLTASAGSVEIDSTVATLIGSQTLTNKTLGATAFTGAITTNSTFDTRDVATDGTKLDTIETNATADQTGAQIKTAYEAETNAFTDAQFTKLSNIETAATADQTGAQIKTLYQAETNAFTDAQFTKLSNIEASATADQTNAEIRAAVVAATNSNAFTDAEKSKLNAIEASATADQTAAEIRVLVGSATDSNVYTDALNTKLAAIEASADVTDATNVNAAGALMLSDTTTAGLGIVVDEDNMASDLATKVPTQQSVKAYVDAQVATKDALSELSGDMDDISDGTTFVKTANNFTDALKTSLETMEDNADVTDATNVEAAGAVMESGNTASAKIPAGTTAQRDGSPSAGFFRWNTTNSSAEIYDGSAWGLVGGGNTTGKVMWEHSYTVAENYEITSGNNAVTAGPITINSGFSVTVPSGSSWAII